MTAIPAELIDQYRRTEYHVDAPGAPFMIRVEQPSPDLAALLARENVSSAAFMTAYNPYSRKATDEENRAANARLRRELDEAEFEVLPARAVNPLGDWPVEHSFLIVGMERALAEEFGRRYQQNAIVFAAADSLPRLVLLR
jgi:hypothetical protein